MGKNLELKKVIREVGKTMTTAAFQNGRLKGFNVRVHVPPPLRCYKCQRYGQTANVSKWHKDQIT